MRQFVLNDDWLILFMGGVKAFKLIKSKTLAFLYNEIYIS